MEAPIEKAQRVSRERREAGEEIIRLNPMEKAKANPKSRALAINAKCWDCSGESRSEIRDCPLYQFRPYQARTNLATPVAKE